MIKAINGNNEMTLKELLSQTSEWQPINLYTAREELTTNGSRGWTETGSICTARAGGVGMVPYYGHRVIGMMACSPEDPRATYDGRSAINVYLDVRLNDLANPNPAQGS